MIPASASVRLREALRAAPDGPLAVAHRGPGAVYAVLPTAAGDRCVGVVAARAVAVPCAVRLAIPVLGALAGQPASVRGGRLHLGPTPVAVTRAVDTRVPPLRGCPVLVGAAPEPHLRVPALAALPPVTAATLPSLVGRGEGLTPLGDDVICGWLALHRAVGHPTPDVDAALAPLLVRTTVLSATLLECAAGGEVVPELTAYVVALGTPREAAAAGRLDAIGGTSGAGLRHGVLQALRGLAGRVAA